MVFDMYFFDTYAIIEVMERNPDYERFENFRLITGVMNLGEIYNIILSDKGKESADEWFNNYNLELLEITPEIMINSVYFRHINRKKNISSTDAVGYVLSLKHKLKFLTGDRQFENMPNVEYVK